MLQNFAKLPHFWANYHFDYIFEGVNIFYYLHYKPEFSTSPPLHHTTPRKKKNSTNTHRSTTNKIIQRNIHLLSSVPPSNMQYQIRPTCKCDTEECMRAGGERKISFLIPKTSQAQEFSVNSETLSGLQQNTYIIFQLHMLVLSKYRVGGFLWLIISSPINQNQPRYFRDTENYVELQN